MLVMITGGAGFIGANLARQLELAGHSVLALDDLSTGLARNLDGTDTQLIVGSILDVDLLASATEGVDAIVHLGARPSVPAPRSPDPSPTPSPPISSTRPAPSTCSRRPDATGVGTSSAPDRHRCTAPIPSYPNTKAWPHDRSAPTPPRSWPPRPTRSPTATPMTYRPSLSGSSTCSDRSQAPGHAYAAVIPAFVDAALRLRPIPVHGDGTQSRDFTFVDTVCAVITDAVNRGVSHDTAVNLAYGTRTDLLSVIDQIAGLVDGDITVEHQPPRPGDVAHSQASDDLVRELFPDILPVPLEIGLKATVDWMRTEA